MLSIFLLFVKGRLNSSLSGIARKALKQQTLVGVEELQSGSAKLLNELELFLLGYY